LPQIGNNQPRSKPGNHFWKMFAVWPACNGADGISDIEHVASEGMEGLGKAT